jgi:hypothetical protein
MEESTMSSPLLIARTLDNALYLLPAMANRHGLSEM